jgi:hypothetical protein
MVRNMSETIVWFVKEVVVIYVFWIFLHWLSGILYAKYCTSVSILGLIMSPYRATLPHCMAFRWIIFNGGKMIEVMWMLLGKWVIEQLIFYKFYNR